MHLFTFNNAILQLSNLEREQCLVRVINAVIL